MPQPVNAAIQKSTSDYDASYVYGLYGDDGNEGMGPKERADYSFWPVRS
jgi:hypothetical protein